VVIELYSTAFDVVCGWVQRTRRGVGLDKAVCRCRAQTGAKPNCPIGTWISDA
jgi:hypothetical protein